MRESELALSSNHSQKIFSPDQVKYALSPTSLQQVHSPPKLHGAFHKPPMEMLDGLRAQF